MTVPPQVATRSSVTMPPQRHLPLAKRARGAPPAVDAEAVATAMMKFDIPVQQILKVMDEADAENPLHRKLCDAEFQKFSKLITPYGPVCQWLEVPSKSGGTHRVYVNNPFALIYATGMVNRKFGSFLKRHLGSEARLAFYSDETTPGNALRPDNGRKYEALLFTFPELPVWYRQRKHGFFRFSYVLSHVVEDILGGMPTLLRHMLRLFFAESDFNIAVSGATVPIESDEEAHFFARFNSFVLDEKAAHINFGVKGASGLKCCLECRNVCNIKGAKTNIVGHDYLVAYTEPDRSKWDPHTPESFAEMVAILEALKDSPVELKEMEIVLGLTYDVHGVLFDPYIKELIQLPHGMYWDSMHCMYASGAIGQLEVNGFIIELLNHGISLETLDAFTNDIRGVKLGKKFFQSRTVLRVDAHIKAFAAEVIDCVYVLALFAHIVLTPAGVMQARVECLMKLYDVTVMLGQTNDIVRNVDLLEKASAEHHECYNRLYKSIPKEHLHRHVVDKIRKHGFYISCWAPERDHHFSKMIAHCAYNKCTQTVLDRCNYHFFTDIMTNEDMLREIHLQKPTKTCDAFASELRTTLTVKAASKIMCQIGGLAHGDYLHVYDVSTRSPVLVVCDFFLEVASRFASPLFFLVCYVHSSVSPGKWVSNSGKSCINIQCVLQRAVAHIDSDSGLVQTVVR